MLIQICVFRAFALVPKNTLMRKCCLIHLKENSTCQRWRYRSAINSGFSAKLLVRNTRRLPASFLTTTQRSVVDTVTVLQQGRVLAEGPPHEIRNNNSVRAAYLGNMITEGKA